MVQTRKIMAGLDQAIGAGDLEQEEKFRELLQRNLDQADLLSGGRRGSSDPSLLESFEVWRRARVLIVEDMLGRSLPGLSFGIPSLDEVLSPGLRPGRFMVIGAGTGEGKTILALMMALKTAREGLGVLYLSWEMPGEELLERAAAMETEVPAWRIQKRRLRTTGEDHAALEDWRPPGGLLVPLVSGLKASRIPRLVKRARAKLAVMGLPLALVVLDHLQLIRGGEKAETRALELKDVANLAKEIAMSGCGGHPLAVLGLSQLRRAREAGNPVLGDLKESGGLEEAADTVLLLVRGRDQRRRMTCEARLSVGKNRGGPVGHEVSMTFEEDRLVFE